MKEAVQKALDAFKKIRACTVNVWDVDEEIKALEEALAKQEGQSNFCPQCEALARELKAAKQEQGEPVEIDLATMELAESVGLIGPSSKADDLHMAIQRFHDLICVNATIKAAQMAADAIRETAASRVWVGLTKEQKAIFSIGLDTIPCETVINDIEAVLRANNTQTQPQQEQGEPVAFDDAFARALKESRPGTIKDIARLCVLYTTPQQRKPLTDEQIEPIAIDVLGYGALRKQDMELFTQIVRAIEAAHRITEKGGTT